MSCCCLLTLLCLDIFKGKIFAVNGNQSVDDATSELEHVIDLVIQPGPKQPQQKKKQRPQIRGLCTICMDQPADFMATPCGHQCACEPCLRPMVECPICRTPIVGIFRVFYTGIDDENGHESEYVNERNITTQIEYIDDGGWAQSIRPAVYGSDPVIAIAPSDNTNIPGPIYISVSIDIPDVEIALPVDICCVIDISGSMGQDAYFQDPSDETKTISEGMNQLDIVKHAVKTVIHTLDHTDRLSIVAFDGVAETTFQLSSMTPDGKNLAVRALEALNPRNSTNLWAGLELGLNSLRTAAADNRKRFVFFLTDGQPSDSPPDGEASFLKRYFENYPNFKCMVSTFGFGYVMSSNILLDIAKEGNGTFTFIPDAKIVGTSFVNAVANARTCIELDAR